MLSKWSHSLPVTEKIQAFRECTDITLAYEVRKALAFSLREPKPILDNDSSNGLSDQEKASEYRCLVTNPAFVAGIVDARGMFGINEKWDTRGDLPYGISYNRMELTSTNKALLDALQSIYKGSVQEKYASGEEKMIRGQLYSVKQSSYKWIVSDLETRLLLRSIEPHLVVRKDPLALNK